MATKNTAKPTVKSPPAAKAKDLPVKKDAKGGRGAPIPGSTVNHNETLIGDTLS